MIVIYYHHNKRSQNRQSPTILGGFPAQLSLLGEAKFDPCPRNVQRFCPRNHRQVGESHESNLRSTLQGGGPTKTAFGGFP